MKRLIVTDLKEGGSQGVACSITHLLSSVINTLAHLTLFDLQIDENTCLFSLIALCSNLERIAIREMSLKG